MWPPLGCTLADYFTALCLTLLALASLAFAPPFGFSSSFLSSALTLAPLTLYRRAVRARFELFSSVCRFHGLHGNRRNLLVVHGLSAP